MPPFLGYPTPPHGAGQPYIQPHPQPPSLPDEEEFEAGRCFRVAGPEPHLAIYFLELKKSKRTLFLKGAYLTEHEPPDFGEPANGVKPKDRRFPTRYFNIQRDATGERVLGLRCFGASLTPEWVAPPLSQEEWHGCFLKDGQIIDETSFDDILAAWLRGEHDILRGAGDEQLSPAGVETDPEPAAQVPGAPIVEPPPKLGGGSFVMPPQAEV